MDPAAQKPNALFFLGVVIKALKIFPMGAHVHIENSAVQIIAGMFLGDDGFFDGVHTAHRRAVGIVAAVHISGSHALEPGNLFGFAVVGRTHQVTAGGAGCGKNALHFHGGDDIRVLGIVVSIEL